MQNKLFHTIPIHVADLINVIMDPVCLHYMSAYLHPASLGFPIMHPLCIIKLCEELVGDVSLTIVTTH